MKRLHVWWFRPINRIDWARHTDYWWFHVGRLWVSYGINRWGITD